MKSFGCLVVALWCGLAAAQTPILFSMRNLTGSTLNRTITVTPLDPPKRIGTNTVYGTVFTLQPVNGIARTNLYIGNYRLTYAGLTKSAIIAVPDSTTEQNAAELVQDGIVQVFYIYQTNATGVYQLVGDTNLMSVVDTNTGNTVLWVSPDGVTHGNLRGGTNVPAPALVGVVPLTSIPTLSSNNIDEATDAAYRADSGASDNYPTNHDTGTWTMDGPWTFNGGIIAPGLAGFSMAVSNATSGATATPIWTNSITTNTTLLLGPISITGAGPTNSYGGILSAVFRRGVGAVEFVGSNVLTIVSGGMAASFATNGTDDEVVLTVTGVANENVNWYAQGFFKVQTNGLPAPRVDTITNSILAWWPMDETSGTRADASGGGFTLSLLSGNAIGSTNGLLSNAALLPNNSAYALTHADSDAFSMQVGGMSMTLAGWALLYATNADQVLVSKYAGTTGQNEWALMWVASENTVRLTVYTNAASNSAMVRTATNGVVPGAWVMVGFELDADNMVPRVRIGRGGVLEDFVTGPVMVGYSNTAAVPYFGKRTTTALNGALDNWGLWSRKLTEQEWTDLYNSGAGRNPYQ